MTSGLTGTYEGSCISCLRGTDTGLIFDGPAEWAVAGLINLGLTYPEAHQTLGWTDGCPAGWLQTPIRVCADCAGRVGSGLPVGLVTGDLGELPAIQPRTVYGDEKRPDVP